MRCRRQVRRHREPLHARAPGGFTLIEILVALTVFAVVAIAVYLRTGDVLVQTARLEQRTFAMWVARDQLQRKQLQVDIEEELPARGRDEHYVEAFGREWNVTLDVMPTSSERLVRVEIHVTAEQNGESLDAGDLVGFVAAY